jgi:hypothetical protein
MSLDNTDSPDASRTKTNTNDERARSPVDTGPIDAEVTEEAKAPRAPRVARVADVKPLDVDSVFGGAVQDTPNAKAARAASANEAPKAKRGRKPKAPEPEKSPEEFEAMARGLLTMADGFFRSHVRGRYEEHFAPEFMAQLDAKMKLQEPQIDAMAEPLARGLQENGVDLPWWAQFALAGFGVYAGKLGTLATLDKKVEEHQKANAPAPASEVKPV